MRKRFIDKTNFYPSKDIKVMPVSLEYIRDKGIGGVYLRQKTIRCAVCGKIDPTASIRRHNVCLILDFELCIDGNKWYYVPGSHPHCVEINKLGLLL